MSSRSETIIRCLQGRVWITDGRTGDVILGRDDRYVGPANAGIVVEALEDALVEISR